MSTWKDLFPFQGVDKTNSRKNLQSCQGCYRPIDNKDPMKFMKKYCQLTKKYVEILKSQEPAILMPDPEKDTPSKKRKFYVEFMIWKICGFCHMILIFSMFVINHTMQKSEMHYNKIPR